MVSIYNEKGRKLIVIYGNAEAILRSICETNTKLFSKKTDEELGKITFISLSSTEAKINIGNVYLWDGYIVEFEVT